MKKGVSILIVPLAVALVFTAGCGSSSPSSANSGTVVSSVDAETKTDETPGEGKSDAAEPEKETEKNNGKVTVEECKNKIDMIEKEVLKINADGETSTFETEGADF